MVISIVLGMFTGGYLVHPEQTNLHGICREPLADGTFIPDLPILGVVGVVQEYPLVNIPSGNLT